MAEERKVEIEIFDATKVIPLPKRLEIYQYSLEVFSTDGELVCYDYKNKCWVRIDIYNDTIRYIPVEVKEWVSRIFKEKTMNEEKEIVISLQDYAEQSGKNWVLEEPETFYRYKYEEMTYKEWDKLFG